VIGMGAHASIAGVQEDGCAALRTLAANDDEIKTAIARAGGIEAVVVGMGAHTSIVVVQEHGCAALRNLAANDRTAIATAGGIEAGH